MEEGDGYCAVWVLVWGRRGRRGYYGSRKPNALTTMDFDFKDIWMPHTR